MNKENKPRESDDMLALILFGFSFAVGFLLLFGILWSTDDNDKKEKLEERDRWEYFNKTEKIFSDYYQLNGPLNHLKSTYSMDKLGIEKLAVDSRSPMLKALDVVYNGPDKKEQLNRKELFDGSVQINDVFVKDNVLTIRITAPLDESVELYKKESIHTDDFDELYMVSSDVRNIVLGSLAKFGEKVDVHVALGKVIKDEFNKDKFVAYKLLLDEDNKIYSDYLIKSSDFKKIEDFDTYTMRQLNKLNQVRFD